jgi:ADP-ribosylglycohydrolase
MTSERKVVGALWGAIVGDALGVPVEFTKRSDRKTDPVTGIRGGGTWKQPPGTWSDDSSMILCCTESLLDRFDTDDMGRRLVGWFQDARWTAWNDVFDIGTTTHAALAAVANGTKAELAGGLDEWSNGNGSLVRNLPIALYTTALPTVELQDRAHRTSAITHRHPRSQMACGLHSLLVRRLLAGDAPAPAWDIAKEDFRDAYTAPEWTQELGAFETLMSADLATVPESEINSGGYVLSTLTAAVWCLLTSKTYAETTLKAVNLGGDTDTTGCAAGGLAGLAYGFGAIPQDWIRAIARKGDIDLLVYEFAETILRSAGQPGKP